MKIGGWGNPEITAGGLALKFYSSIRLELRKGPALKYKEEVIGNVIKAKIVKNKVAPPFKKAEFEIYYGRGISTINDLINVAISKDIIKKLGTWLHYKNKKWQGHHVCRAFLKENPKLLEEIKKEVINNI